MAALILAMLGGTLQAHVVPVLGAAQPVCSLPRKLTVPGGTPQALALDPGARLLIVATTGEIDLLDSCTGKLKARRPAGGVPSQLAIDSSARRALVLVEPRVRLFDTHTLRWLPDLRLPVDALPQQIAVSSGTHQALILDPGNATLWIADTRSGKVGHHVASLPGTQDAVAMDASRHHAFVASVGTNTVSVIDTTRWRVLRTTAVGRWPLALVVSVHTGRVFVANRDSKSVSMLETGSGRLLHTATLRLPPRALAIDERLRRVYVVTRGNGKDAQEQLVALDAATGKPVNAQRSGPQGPVLTVDPQTGTVFYVDPNTRSIVVASASAAAGQGSSSGGTPHPTATKARPTVAKQSTPVTRSAATHTPTRTAPTLTPAPSFTPRPTATATAAPTGTPAPTSTFTSTPTPTNTATSTPTDTATSTPTPTASPTPVVVSSGSGTLQGTWEFNFDTGSQVSSGGDVWWDQQTSTVRQMTPVGSALLVNLGVVDFNSLTPATLKSLSYSSTPLDGNNDATNQLIAGDVFAVKTNGGNLAKVQVQSYGYTLQIQWVTYAGTKKCVNLILCAKPLPTLIALP